MKPVRRRGFDGIREREYVSPVSAARIGIRHRQGADLRWQLCGPNSRGATGLGGAKRATARSGKRDEDGPDGLSRESRCAQVVERRTMSLDNRTRARSCRERTPTAVGIVIAQFERLRRRSAWSRGDVLWRSLGSVAPVIVQNGPPCRRSALPAFEWVKFELERGRRIRVRVDALVPNPVSVLVHPPEGLLKQPRWW
jgi:hypothetical protein